MGADDYLTKPFSMRKLMARVKALPRRVELIRQDVVAETGTPSETHRPAPLTSGNLVIDEMRREIRPEGRPVAVKPKEFDRLLFWPGTEGRPCRAISSWSACGAGPTTATAVPWTSTCPGSGKRSSQTRAQLIGLIPHLIFTPAGRRNWPQARPVSVPRISPV